MAYDGLLARACARELAETLCGCKIEKITQPEKDQIVLYTSAKGSFGHFKVLLDISAGGGHISLTNLDFENPKEPPAFCMFLRKHLTGARIENIYQIDRERIIVFEFETINEIGYSVNKKLICESLGRYGNIILADCISNKIIDCARRILTDEVQVLPGMVYEQPTKKGLENDLGYGKTTKIAVEMGSDPGKCIPSVWEDDNLNPKDVHIIDMPQYDGVYNRLSFESIAEALDYYYSNRLESNHFLQTRGNFERQVKGIADKYINKKVKLLDEIDKADNAEDYRIKGEIITANISKIKPGSKKVVLTNYYDGSDIEIALDEKLSPSKNGQAYFKKYSKLKNSKKEKEAQLSETENAIIYLESVISNISLSDYYSQLDQIREELIGQGFIREKKNDKKRVKIKFKPGYIDIKGGKTCIIGSNNLENDYITFKLAKKGDYWLHTKDIHGAHVILSCKGEEPTHEEIRSAAEIAAYYSKGRFSGTVPVDYVPIKYVKKPNNARPGMVIFTNNKTIYVDPMWKPGNEI